MKQFFLKILKFLLFMSIGLGILYYAYYTQNNAYQQEQCFAQACQPEAISFEDCNCSESQLAEYSLMDKLKLDLGRVNYFLILLSVSAFMLSNVSRAIRWKMLIDPLGKKVRLMNTFLGVMVGYMANAVLPRAGEVVRCGVLSRYEDVSVDKLLGTVTVSRLLDVISLGIVTTLMLVFESGKVLDYLSEQISGKGSSGDSPIVWILLAVAIAGAAAIWVFRKKILAIPLVQKLWNMVLGFAEGLKSISKIKHVGWFIFHSVSIWALYYAMTYIALLAFPATADLSPLAGLTVFVFGSLGMVIPTPGGLGAYQVLVSTALTLFYTVEKADAFSASNILFFPTFFTILIIGVTCLILFPILNKKKVETNPL